MASYEDLERSVLKSIGRLPDPTIQDILKRRFGLGTGVSQTLEEVGEALGLTREAVLQQERAGLEQLKGVERLSPEEAEEFWNSEIGQSFDKGILGRLNRENK